MHYLTPGSVDSGTGRGGSPPNRGQAHLLMAKCKDRHITHV